MEYQFFVNDFDRVSDPVAQVIFKYPTSFWFGVKPGKTKFHNLENRVRRLLTRAAPATPVLVVYNLPNRDIGQHSKGGAKDTARYLDYISRFAAGIGDASPIVIYEPDGLPHATLLSEYHAEERYDLIKRGLTILTNNSNSIVYVDVGHSNWLSPSHAGALINRIHVPKLRGFSVNVSNFRTTVESETWGNRVAEYSKSQYFVIDTSRNGSGPYGNDWCNPPGRSLGTPATTITNSKNCDAYLWIKVPGESDGKCNGGPAAGKFWIDYARDLVRNTTWIR